MTDELNLGESREAGIEKTAAFVGEVVPQATAESVAAGKVDPFGTVFNPEIHQADAEGNPIRGSKRRFLLKKEAKKSGYQRIKDGFSKLWNGEETENPDNPDNPESPLSDHELLNNTEEKQKIQMSEPAKTTPQRGIVTASAENSADIFFLGGSMALGIEFLNQRNRFHPQVAEAITDYERRTGKSIDLPPGLALACGLGRIAWEIIQAEPACKQRFDSGAKVVRDNAIKFIGRKIPKFGKPAVEEVTA